jgi:fatty-acyl-CoA synthase
MPTYRPRSLPPTLRTPRTTIPQNLEISTTRYPDETAIAFFGNHISYKNFSNQVDRFAAWLQDTGIQKGDRVALYLQNAPQFLIAFYGVMRADAIVVTVNPMLKAAEAACFLNDSGARLLVCAQNLAAEARAAAQAAPTVEHILAACYADHLPTPCEYKLQDWVTAPRQHLPGITPWSEIDTTPPTPAPATATPDDPCLLLYTSGSTGGPKGALHTHATLMFSIAGLSVWHGQSAANRVLGVPPMYQMSGLANAVLGTVYNGAMVAPVPRWERDLVARLIEREQLDYVSLAPTALIDLLASPNLDQFDLGSIRRLTAGGAPMPAEIWRRIDARLGLPFIEVYGMTEAGTLLANPVERPKPQCLGLPFFDTDIRIVDPETLEELPPGEPGEIIAAGPQLSLGYWNRPAENAAAFIEWQGRRFYRTGDIGAFDEEGYCFMTDRLKRMINAAGFKVWPADVEATLYKHPDIAEVCVIATPDSYRGETVKALIVRRDDSVVTEQEIIDWSHGQMAAYKRPRQVAFVAALPKSPAGKILWRELQDREKSAVA